MQVICENPRFIVNPLAKELIAQHCNYYIRGKKYSCPTLHKRFLYEFDTKSISPYRLQITREDLDSCFVCDRSSGVTYPLYLEVACGHCSVCKARKMNSFVHRCLIESLNYNCKPIFLTLTYEEKNRKKGGLNLRDCQLFLKRLRINLHRHGYREKIRYALVGEYGRNTHREHYHALLWNLHQTNLLEIRDIVDIIKKSWNLGFIMWRFVEPSDDKGFSYTAKYMRKDMVIPKGCCQPFLLSSRRGGGIGYALPESAFDSITRRNDVKPQIFNRFSGKSQALQLNSYYLNKLFPSFSKSLPPKLKSNLRDYLLCYSTLKYIHHYETEKYDKEAKAFSNFFGKYFYCPILEHSQISKGMVYPSAYCHRQMAVLLPSLESAFNLGQDYYDRALEVQRKRDYFLSKLFRYANDLDIEFRGYVTRRSFALAQEREIF